jgi:hypothetical protein
MRMAPREEQYGWGLLRWASESIYCSDDMEAGVEVKRASVGKLGWSLK